MKYKFYLFYTFEHLKRLIYDMFRLNYNGSYHFDK